MPRGRLLIGIDALHPPQSAQNLTCAGFKETRQVSVAETANRSQYLMPGVAKLCATQGVACMVPNLKKG